MVVYGVDVLLVNVAFADLDVHRFIRDESKHLTVADVQFHEVHRVCSSL